MWWRVILFFGVIGALALVPREAAAVVGYADVVLDYFDSGAGPIPGPYGGFGYPDGTVEYPVPVPLDVVLGPEVGGGWDALSLPTGSFVVVGFEDDVIPHRAGIDFLLNEKDNGEQADVFASSDLQNFVFVGTATGTTGFDLEGTGLSDPVRAVKIVGLDAAGGSPGYDLLNVQVQMPIQWELAAGGNGHWYEFVPSAMTWDEARTAAEASTHAGVPGHLATITSQAENDFIVDNFNETGAMLGGFQPPGSAEPDGGWEWITGEPFDFTNWHTGEPNNRYQGGFGGDVPYGSSEERLHFHPGSSTAGWNDAPTNSILPGFIVEYPVPVPEPSTLVLAAIACLGVLAYACRRRRAIHNQT